MSKPLKADPYAEDVELRSLIIAILKKRKGIGIDLFGLLQIDDLENGHARVLDQRDWDQDISFGTEYKFQDIKEGVDFFLNVRKERKLGYDFDRKRDREDAIAEMEADREFKQASKIRLIDENWKQNSFYLYHKMI